MNSSQKQIWCIQFAHLLIHSPKSYIVLGSGREVGCNLNSPTQLYACVLHTMPQLTRNNEIQITIILPILICTDRTQNIEFFLVKNFAHLRWKTYPLRRLSIFPCELFPCGKFFPAIDSRRETGKKFPAGNFKNIV